MDRYIPKAISVARKSTMTHRHGCVAVHKGQIIASAYNYVTSSCQSRIPSHEWRDRKH
jgi:deoxycytidylate deaminase